MNSKNKIFITIIAVAFLLTVFFLYKTFVGPSAEEVTLEGSLLAPTDLNILPLGNKFDIGTVKKLNTQFNVFNYPEVSTDSIGVSTSNLIKSPSEPVPSPDL